METEIAGDRIRRMRCRVSGDEAGAGTEHCDWDADDDPEQGGDHALHGGGRVDGPSGTCSGSREARQPCGVHALRSARASESGDTSASSVRSVASRISMKSKSPAARKPSASAINEREAGRFCGCAGESPHHDFAVGEHPARGCGVS